MGMNAGGKPCLEWGIPLRVAVGAENVRVDLGKSRMSWMLMMRKLGGGAF